MSPDRRMSGTRAPKGVPRAANPIADRDAPESLRRRRDDDEKPDAHVALLAYACQPAALRRYHPLAALFGRGESVFRKWRAKFAWEARIAACPDAERWAAYLLGRMYPALLARPAFERIPGADDVLALFQGGTWARGSVDPEPAGPPPAPAPRVVPAAEPASLPPPPPRAVQAVPPPPAPAVHAPAQAPTDPRDVLPRALIGQLVRDMQAAQASSAAGQPVDPPVRLRSPRELADILRYIDRRERDLRDQASPAASGEDDPEVDLDGLRVRRALATGDDRLVLAALQDEAEEVAYLARRLLGGDDDGGGLRVLDGGRTT